MREAFVTGIGWVTGDGIGWGRQGGECGFGKLPLPLLSRPDVFPKPNQRFGRMSEYAKTGVAAVAFALRDAGMESWTEKRNIGVVASTTLGSLATDLDYQQGVLLDGGGLASPNLFAYTLANCFLGDVAIQFGLTGSSLAINESGHGVEALRIALEELAMGGAETMLAGICDLPPPPPFQWEASVEPGSVFVVLSATVIEGGESYGALTLAGDGTVIFGGLAIGSMRELVLKALSGRERQIEGRRC